MVIIMEKIIIGSIRSSAGKTSMVLGMANAIAPRKRIGYMKPFGDRLIYRKKQLWDYDSALITKVLNLKVDPADISIGFEHAKLRYMYNEASLKKKLIEKISHIGKENDILFIEGGKHLAYGISIHLDPISVTKQIDGKLIIVIRGIGDAIIDDITFLKKNIDMTDINFGGVIINQVHDVEDFKNTFFENITDMGVNVLGIIPYKEELTHFSVEYLTDYLFAKVIAGEDRLNNIVKNIFVGAMSANQAFKDPRFKKENRLIITSGDRSDIIVGALENNTTCILLTNNIMPSPNIISKVQDHNIPLLLVPSDTFQTAKQIDDMEPLLTENDTKKIELLTELMKKYVDLKVITRS